MHAYGLDIRGPWKAKKSAQNAPRQAGEKAKLFHDEELTQAIASCLLLDEGEE